MRHDTAHCPKRARRSHPVHDHESWPVVREPRRVGAKKCSGLPPYRVLSLEGASPIQHPPAARLRCRLTEDHIRALGRQSFLASLRPPRRAKLAGIGDAREHGG